MVTLVDPHRPPKTHPLAFVNGAGNVMKAFFRDTTLLLHSVGRTVLNVLSKVVETVRMLSDEFRINPAFANEDVGQPV